MAQPAFNLGRDARLDIVINGVALKPTLLTSFNYSQDVKDVTSPPLNSRPIHMVIPNGWKGTAEYDRSDSTLDDYFSQQEDNYWAGVASPEIFITQTVRDANTGAPSAYRFEGVTLKLADGGTYKADDRVQQKVEFMATARRKVA